MTLAGLILLGSDQISFYMHSSSTPSQPTCYFVGLDVHRDTIAAYVYDSDARCPYYETEFCAQTSIKLTRFVTLSIGDSADSVLVTTPHSPALFFTKIVPHAGMIVQ